MGRMLGTGDPSKKGPKMQKVKCWACLIIYIWAMSNYVIPSGILSKFLCIILPVQRRRRVADSACTGLLLLQLRNRPVTELLWWNLAIGDRRGSGTGEHGQFCRENCWNLTFYGPIKPKIRYRIGKITKYIFKAQKYFGQHLCMTRRPELPPEDPW